MERYGVDLKRAQEKYDRLLELLREMGSVGIAFSGGVDSTLLLYAAHEALGENTAAMTALSPAFPGREQEEAAAFCAEHGIRRVCFESDELHAEGYAANPPDRCYLCKKHIFGKLIAKAAELGFNTVAEGSNVDDDGDYRPGMRAIAELHVRSPLKEAGLTKAEIRLLSREKGLPTWNKQSSACLASRLAYGEVITEEKLRMVGSAEEFLRQYGFPQYRVRLHGMGLARIEVPQEYLTVLLENRVEITKALRELGFQYVTMDLIGYRTGSMNEVLQKE